jgi:hypothetical protein
LLLEILVNNLKVEIWFLAPTCSLLVPIYFLKYKEFLA